MILAPFAQNIKENVVLETDFTTFWSFSSCSSQFDLSCVGGLERARAWRAFAIIGSGGGGRHKSVVGRASYTLTC